MSVFAQQQQALPTMPFAMPNGAVPPFNMGMNMMQFPPQMLAMFAQQQQAGASSPIATQSPPPMVPQMQENFATALMDIMKMYGAIPGGMPMGQWPMFPGTIPPHMQQQQQGLAQSTSGSSGSGTAVREGSYAASGSRGATESPRLSLPVPAPHSPSPLQPSIKRKRESDGVEHDGTDELPVSEDVEEEEDDDEPPLASLVKKKKVEEKQKRKGGKEERKARKASLQYTTPARNPHESPSQVPKPSTSTDSTDKLFVSNGKPTQFFVQVDLKDRLEVVRAIKVCIPVFHMYAGF